MTTLQDRMSAGLKHAGLSQSALARRADVGQSLVNRWCGGRIKSISGKYLSSVASAMGVTETWLACGSGPMLRAGGPVLPPVIAVLAGSNQSQPHEVISAELPLESVRQLLGRTFEAGELAMFTHYGFALMPAIGNGEVILIEAVPAPVAADGFYVVDIEGLLQLKQVLRVSGGWQLSGASAALPGQLLPMGLVARRAVSKVGLTLL